MDWPFYKNNCKDTLKLQVLFTQSSEFTNNSINWVLFVFNSNASISIQNHTLWTDSKFIFFLINFKNDSLHGFFDFWKLFYCGLLFNFHVLCVYKKNKPLELSCRSSTFDFKSGTKLALVRESWRMEYFTKKDNKSYINKYNFSGSFDFNNLGTCIAKKDYCIFLTSTVSDHILAVHSVYDYLRLHKYIYSHFTS